MPLTHQDKLFRRHALDEVKSINQLFKPEIVGHKAGVPIKELEAVVNNLAKEGIIELHQADTGTHRISFTEPELFPKAVDGRDSSSGDPFSVDEHDAVDQVA